MHGYRRKLDDKKQLAHFLMDVLGVSDFSDEQQRYLRDIVSIELSLSGIGNKSTLKYEEYRDIKYSSSSARKALCKRIYNELISLKLLENDDDIELGRGGAIPSLGISCNRKAYYIIGLPASGKSTVAYNLAQKVGAVILDSDFAKRKFPEYADDYGASVTHEESAAIIFGDSSYDGNNVLDWAIGECANIVIPKIGNKKDNVLDFVGGLQKTGYEVHLILVRLDRLKSTRRAYKRYIETSRYIPLSLIFDEYANDPTITYYDLKNFHRELFCSFTMISTDVEIGSPPKILEASKNSPFVYE